MVDYFSPIRRSKSNAKVRTTQLGGTNSSNASLSMCGTIDPLNSHFTIVFVCVCKKSIPIPFCASALSPCCMGI